MISNFVTAAPAAPERNDVATEATEAIQYFALRIKQTINSSTTVYSTLVLPEKTRSTMIEGGVGFNNFVPVLREDGTKIAPTGDIFDQPHGGRSWIRGKLADHVGDNVILSPEEGV